MEYIRTEFVHKGTSTTADETEIKLIKAEEFTYTDPVDGSSVSGQGLILSFQFSDGDPARVVFRLSGTGSTGATIRVYLEKFEKDSAKHHVASPVALKNLATLALRLVRIEELTGRHAPTVIT
jgi:phosphoglucomutase